MLTRRERFVVDEEGKRTEVILEVEDYYKLLDELEELEAIRAFDMAKASGADAIPFEQAVLEIE